VILALMLAGLAATAEPATCSFDDAAPEPCHVSFTAGTGGATTLRAKGRSGRQMTFVGKRASGWWAGTLDGAPAMGHELNRGNVAFATRALDHSFQYWTRGNEHGTY
jgi:hypothetical protein